VRTGIVVADGNPYRCIDGRRSCLSRSSMNQWRIFSARSEVQGTAQMRKQASKVTMYKKYGRTDIFEVGN